MRPSSASSTAATITSAAALSNVPRIEAQIERYPQKRLPTVNSVGRTKSPRERRSRAGAFMPASLPPRERACPGANLVAAADENLALVGREQVDSRAELDHPDSLRAGELGSEPRL